jgi:hypothetical protein
MQNFYTLHNPVPECFFASASLLRQTVYFLLLATQMGFGHAIFHPMVKPAKWPKPDTF